MAKSNETFDQIFKEKLDGHQEKPSALAWERLDSQLSKSKKPGVGFWWAIAASLSALLMVAYLNWPSEVVNSEDKLVASAEEIQDEMPPSQNQVGEPEEISSPESTIENKPDFTPEKPKVKSNQTQTKTQKVNPSFANNQKQTQANSLVAEASSKSLEKKVEPIRSINGNITEPEVSLPALKAPDLTKTVAEVQSKASEEPLYRVSIYSNGIKKSEPTDKNLFTELGKTVGQVEGLLGKVDEGFAEIQDKKDNLFASLTSKRADEKP